MRGLLVAAVAAALAAGCSSSATSVAADGPPADRAPLPIDAAPAPDLGDDSSGAPITAPPVDAGDDGAAAWPAIADYGARGPFPTIRETNTGPSGAYDVFRPAQLGGEGRRHPVVSWANGTLFSVNDYQRLLDHWASYGFVVIAAHSNSTAGGATHRAGIEWLRALAAQPGTAYHGVIDAQRVAAAGHSQGGGATLAAGSAGSNALTTTLTLMPLLRFEADDTVVTQTVPMLNINATMDDRDPTGRVAAQIFNGAGSELVQAAYVGVHEDAMNPVMHGPTVAWLRYRLMGDERARALFYPPGGCGLCQDRAWKEVRYRPGS